MTRPPQEVGHLPAEVLFYPLLARPCTHVFSGSDGIGGRRHEGAARIDPPPPAQHGKRLCRAADEKLSENNVVNELDFNNLRSK